MIVNINDYVIQSHVVTHADAAAMRDLKPLKQHFHCVFSKVANNGKIAICLVNKTL